MTTSVGRGAPSPDGVPALLRERVHEALGADAGRASPDACLDAAERMLVRVLCSDGGSRATAVDLLTADALVTQAFELAADAPDGLDALADTAMRRIAASAGER